LWLLVHGCDTGSGGAVELSWKLRPVSSAQTDKFVGCTDDSQPPKWSVDRIRLHWEVAGEVGAHDWACDDNHGATGFELPQGPAELSITPECSPTIPAAPGTYIAPAAVQRDVIRGETVSLGAVELVVTVLGCPACVCPTPL